MVNSRAAFFLLAILLLVTLGGLFFFHPQSNQEPWQVFPATIDRDCAPWDGAAFTVTIQYDSETVIYITIWMAPDIKFPTTFPMSDDVEAEQDGYAYILPELDPFTPLYGDVSFKSVSVDTPVEGRFKFTSEQGDQFEGRFIAEWGDKIVYCG